MVYKLGDIKSVFPKTTSSKKSARSGGGAYKAPKITKAKLEKMAYTWLGKKLKKGMPVPKLSIPPVKKMSDKQIKDMVKLFTGKDLK